jgi:large subunit ribosomal protein L21
MYAVIETGGKQYCVKEGDRLDFEKLPGGSGKEINFNKVLLIADGDKISVGKPHVASASVSGEVIKQDRAYKVAIFKYKKRKYYRRRAGHRQYTTTVLITKIKAAK